MILLDTTTRSLEIILGGAVTTNQLPWVVSYVDTGATPPLVNTNGNTNSGTLVTMVSAPSAGKVKIIKDISVYNNDTVNATVTIRLNDNSTLRKIFVATLPTGYHLQFTDEGSWIVSDANGSIVNVTTTSGTAGGDLTGTYPNPTIAAGAVTEAKQTLADVTTNDVTSTKHGYAPKAPADATKFLNGAATPAYAQVKDSDLSTSDVTTNDVTTSKHGFVLKAPNDTTKFFRGNATWAVPASSGGKPFIQWTAAGNQPPASAYATPDTRNSHLVLDFDGATDEEAVFAGVLPTAYAGGGLTCETWWAFTTATTGSLRVQADIERMDVSSLDTDADSFTGTFQSAGGSAPGTSGQLIKVTITFSSGAQMDSLAAGEAFRLKIRRDADGTSGTDDITTDAELFRIVLRET